MRIFVAEFRAKGIFGDIVMKKLNWSIGFTILLAACSGKKTDGGKTMESDSDSLKVQQDSLILSGEKEYKAEYTHADNLFDDFLYAFSTDNSFQQKRIMFPLTYKANNQTTLLPKEQWKGAKMFPKANVYIVLYDHSGQTGLEKDQSLTSASVQWIYPAKKTVETFHFQKKKQCWLLSEVDKQPLAQADKGGFISFYERFATDSVFASRSVKEPLTFITNETSSDTPIEGVLAIPQWFAFKPQLPSGQLLCINYGQQNQGLTQKTMVIKGVSSGFRYTLTFRKGKNKRWMLTQYMN